ncbi:hypothetical protein [Marilutibacter chinensis]|uniref:Uncharacterized protein n=1 Tax=Marilutibacter chinensis TaxID=2912247 RepID=A0ABS9HR58_9GAMM|nr:hypothetical protein [Lysobacter chinensis]MCF7220714.1 hypothetical protein [Lysobacter chinensis]
MLAQETDARQKAEIIASEATFYGTFLAALGVAIDKVGVRNTGAGAATLSGLFTGRYRLADQQVVLRKAEARAACLEKTLTPAVFDQKELERLTGDSRSRARATAESMKLGDAAILNAADNPALNRWALSEAETLVANASTGRERIPELTWRALRRLTNDLRIALAGIPLTPMTRDQMQQTINDAVTQEELAEGRAEAAIKSSGAPDPETARMLKELAAAAAVEATMEACFVEYPQ